MMPEYEDALRELRECLGDDEPHPEYERGAVGMVARLYPIKDMDTDTRMGLVLSDLRGNGEEA